MINQNQIKINRCGIGTGTRAGRSHKGSSSTDHSPLGIFLGLIVLSVDVELVFECVLPVRSLMNDRRAAPPPPPPELLPGPAPVPAPPVLLFGDMGAVAVAVEGLVTEERCCIELLTTMTFGSR